MTNDQLTQLNYNDLETQAKLLFPHGGSEQFRLGWLRSMIAYRDVRIGRLEAEIERLKNAK